MDQNTEPQRARCAPLLDKAETPAEAIGLALGAASACWSDLRTAGVFESDEASRIGRDLEARLVELAGPREVQSAEFTAGLAEGGLTPEPEPVCQDCGQGRLSAHGTYSPVQPITGLPLGWYSGDDGEFCSHCIADIMGQANRRIYAAQGPRREERNDG